jgi:hypothetical protein
VIRKVLCVLALIVLGVLSINPVHAQTKTSGLVITIIRPGEGETLYSSASLMFVGVPVTGFVAAENIDPSQLQVRLEVIQGAKSTGSLTTTPRADGTFSFDVGINHNSLSQEANAEKGCSSNCHSGLSLILPTGRLFLRATVIDPMGNKAVAERSITVDQSDYVDLPVQVVLDGEAGHASDGIVVTAETRLYLWRTRQYSAKTDVNGRAVINVERLQEAPTRYVIQIEPRVVNGAMPISRAPIQVTLPPGATQVAPVTLIAQLQPGQIQGTIDSKGLGVSDSVNFNVRAIAVSSGAAFTTKATQGKFVLPNLPINKYLVMVDDADAIAQAVQIEPQTVDLTAAPAITTTLKVRNDLKAVRGIVHDNQGNPLPFAWLANDRKNLVARVAPTSGEFVFNGLAGSDRTLWVTAPGYWSQPVAVADRLDIALTPMPNTRSVPWGSGKIIIPEHTRANVSGNEISIVRGWIWGSGTGAMIIRTSEIEVALGAGSFALEYVAGETNWLYVMDGQAQVTAFAAGKTVTVGVNQMLASGKGTTTPTPVALDADTVRALHRNEPSQVAIETDSAITARLHDEIERRGVSSTLVALVLGLGVALLVGMRWQSRRR